jgi:hypothetical protein
MKDPKEENKDKNKENEDWDLGVRQCNVGDGECESCQ